MISLVFESTQHFGHHSGYAFTGQILVDLYLVTINRCLLPNGPWASHIERIFVA